MDVVRTDLGSSMLIDEGGPDFWLVPRCLAALKEALRQVELCDTHVPRSGGGVLQKFGKSLSPPIPEAP